MASKNSTLLLFDRLGDRFEKIVANMLRVDDSLHNIQPAEGKWSNVQVLNHLFTVEDSTLKYLKYKLGNGENFPKQKLWTVIKLYIYMAMLKSPLKFKAPEVVAHPSNDETIEAMLTKYRNMRQEFKSLLQSQDDTFFKFASCKHALIGRLTMANMIRFFVAHLNHHEKQIFRNLISIANQ